jgi:hypothetical protein
MKIQIILKLIIEMKIFKMNYKRLLINAKNKNIKILLILIKKKILIFKMIYI